MIVAGFGFRKGASLASLQAAMALAQRGGPRVTLLATVADKAEALEPLAAVLELPLATIRQEDLAILTTLTRSAASLSARGTGSMAEACALAAAGPGARLLGPRDVSPDRMATCAIAQGIAS